MTEQKLKQANQLKNTIDKSLERKKALEEVLELCQADADIESKDMYRYSLHAVPLMGGRDQRISISAIGACEAINHDIADIEKEIKILEKEFDEL